MPVDAEPAQALAVEPIGAGLYAVACGGSCGGTAAHVVTIGADASSCDCPASMLAHRTCRHILAVRQFLQLAPLDVPLRNAPAASGYSTPQPAASAEPGLLTAVHEPCEATIAAAAGPGLETGIPFPDDQPDGSA